MTEPITLRVQPRGVRPLAALTGWPQQTYGSNRACACGALLSRYNPGVTCRPCQDAETRRRTGRLGEE